MKKTQRTPFNRSSQTRSGGQLRNRPSSSAAQPQQQEHYDDEGPEEVGVDQPETSMRRRRMETGPDNVESNAMIESLNGIHAQVEDISVLIHAGFTGMKERMENMAERQEHLEQEMRA